MKTELVLDKDMMVVGVVVDGKMIEKLVGAQPVARITSRYVPLRTYCFQDPEEFERACNEYREQDNT